MTSARARTTLHDFEGQGESRHPPWTAALAELGGRARGPKSRGWSLGCIENEAIVDAGTETSTRICEESHGDHDGRERVRSLVRPCLSNLAS